MEEKKVPLPDGYDVIMHYIHTENTENNMEEDEEKCQNTED